MRQHVSQTFIAAMMFLAAGCAQPFGGVPAPSAAASNELPPLENGVYVAHGICIGSEYGCTDEPWRATAPSVLRERPDPASPVVATVATGDLAWPIGGQLRFAPRRGVVTEDVDYRDLGRLEAGDVVYMLEPLGEGTYSIWRRGQTFDSAWAEGDENEPITWDAEPLPLPPGAITGEWTQFRLADGRTGWVAGGDFECADGWCGPPERE